MSSAAVNSGVGEGGERGWGDKGTDSPSRGGTRKKNTGKEDGESFKMEKRQMVKAGMEKK